MLKKQKTLYLGLARECSGGGSASQVDLLSITTAPSGSFAVGSKYYNSSTKKIVTAVTADTWTGATSADPVFNTIYTFNSGYYIWDGNSLEETDLNLYEKTANKTNDYLETSPIKYPSSKALSDALGSLNCAGQIIKPLSVVENILSANTKFAAKTSNFFVYSDGSVSADGKTIYKTNPNTISEGDMTAMAGGEDIVMTINYNNFASYGSMEFFRVSEDGTITSIRKVSGNGSVIMSNSSIRFAGDYVFLYGKPHMDEYLYSLAIADIEDTNIWFTKIGDTTLDGFDYDGINYYAARGGGGQPISYYASVDFNTIFDGSPIIVDSGVGMLNYFGIVDNKLSFAYDNELFGTIHYLTQTVHGSGILNTITLPWTKQYNIVKDIQKIADVYYLMAFDEQYSSYTYHTASSLTAFNATADGVGYNVVGKDKNTIITLNSTSILWSGLKDIEYNDFEKLSYSQLADKTVGNTDVETSLLNKTAGEFVGNTVISPNSLQVGDVIVIKAKGVISTASSAPTTTLKVKFGETDLISNSGALAGNWNGTYFELNTEITIRAIGATGKAIIGGNTLFKDATTISAGVQRALIGTETEIDTTKFSLLDLTYKWSAADASNSITVKQANFEIKRQW